MMVQHALSVMVILATVTHSAQAEEALTTYKSLIPELALDLAGASLADCRSRGYQVAVAVISYHLDYGPKAADYGRRVMAAINWPAVQRLYGGVCK